MNGMRNYNFCKVLSCVVVFLLIDSEVRAVEHHG